MSKNEGEFRKRLFELSTVAKGMTITDTEQFLKVLDEARKDVFESIPIEELKGLTKDNSELVNKLLKWFGGD